MSDLAEVQDMVFWISRMVKQKADLKNQICFFVSIPFEKHPLTGHPLHVHSGTIVPQGDDIGAF
jgi:hypothetical protein